MHDGWSDYSLMWGTTIGGLIVSFIIKTLTKLRKFTTYEGRWCPGNVYEKKDRLYGNRKDYKVTSRVVVKDFLQKRL